MRRSTDAARTGRDRQVERRSKTERIQVFFPKLRGGVVTCVQIHASWRVCRLSKMPRRLYRERIVAPHRHGLVHSTSPKYCLATVEEDVGSHELQRQANERQYSTGFSALTMRKSLKRSTGMESAPKSLSQSSFRWPGKAELVILEVVSRTPSRACCPCVRRWAFR